MSDELKTIPEELKELIKDNPELLDPVSVTLESHIWATVTGFIEAVLETKPIILRSPVGPDLLKAIRAMHIANAGDYEPLSDEVAKYEKEEADSKRIKVDWLD